MARKFRQTAQKRQKEQARQQKQQAKASRRLQAKQRRISGQSEVEEATPDMAGNPPDPQPLPESRQQDSYLA